MSSPSNPTRKTRLGIVVHILGLLFSVIGAGIIYLVASTEFDKENSRNALNWHIFVFVTWNAGILIVFGGVFLESVGVVGSLGSLVLIGGGAGIVGAVGVANLASTLVATINAAKGKTWHYPISLNII